MSSEHIKILGGRIQELRQSGKMTQAQLGEAADLSTNYIGQIERGEAHPTLESLFAIADALRVNPSSLFTPLDIPLNREDLFNQIRELLDKLSDMSK